MGRYSWDKKNTVEDGLVLSLARLREWGLLKGCCSTLVTWTGGASESSVGLVVNVIDSPHIKLTYTITDRSSGEKTDYDYKVALTTTKCNFGGVRYWFVCSLSKNGVYCGRQVGKLYLPPGGKYFGCRHCYDLSYESRNEPRLARPGGIGYPLLLDTRIEKLHKKVKRWTYRGKPTKKARQVKALEDRFAKYASLSQPYLRQ